MVLDPLKFKIAIERGDIQEELRKARKTLEEGLKDVPVHFKIANLEELKKQLGNIEVKINASSSSGANSLRNEKKTLDELKSSAEQAEKSLNRVMQRSVNVAKNESERLSNTLLTAQRTIERFGDKGFDTTRLERYKSMILEIRDNLDKINENKGKHPANGMTAGQYLNREDVSRVVSLMNTELGLYKSIGNEMERIVKLRNELSSVLSANPNSSYAGSLQAAIAGLDLRQGLMARLGPRDALESVNTSAYRSQMAEAISLISKVNTESRQSAQATKQAETENEKWAVSMNRAAIEATNLKLKIQALEQVKGRGVAAGVDVTSLEKKIAQMRNMLTILQSMEAGMKLHGFAGDYIKSAPYVNTLKMADAEASAVSKNAAEKEKAANSTRQLTAEEQKLSSAIQKTIGEMNHQSQVLNDLKTMAFQYLSVYGAQQFLNNIIEIGGQLEMQRLSIGAILQDTAQANDLFDKIKGLALQSPFGVVELDQFTKQLSAYGFKYNELFDMTKRLADISAGAGTDVSRLALALGHVRAEGALTGYTLRQFAMNNIPMLSKLSEKLSELEGRIVTASEVRQRVRNKEIDYSMVESVIKDLTNEGGMFYNMQEVISGSVKAKWKNLRDAFDIMYGEMAESALGGTLKDTATILTSMAKRWKELGMVVFNVAKAYGAYKAVMLVYNTMLGQQARAVLTTIAAQRQAKAANLQMAASYRSLTAAEQGQLLTSTKLSLADKVRMITNRQSAAIIRERIALTQKARIEEIAMAVSTKQLGAEEIARAVALGKLNKNVALLAIGNSKLHATEIASMQATVASVRTYGMLTGVVNTTAMAFTRLGIALKGLLMNPATWIFALIAGLTDLWQRNNQEMERAKELSKSLAERAAEGVKNVNMMMGETGMTYKVNGKETQFSAIPGGQISHTPSSSMDSDAMIQTMEKWEEFIKNYSSMPNTLLQNALFDGDKLRSVTEQYENLATATESVMKSQQALAQIADKAQFIMDYTNEGLDGDDLVTNMDDYAKKIRKADVEVSKFASHHKGAMIAALNAAKSNKTFADSLAYANKMMQEKEGRNLTEEEQIKWLTKYYGDFEVAIRQAEQAIGDLGDKEAMKSFVSVQKASKGENQAEVTLVKDMELAADAIRQTVKEKWHKDISELEEYEKQALLQMVSDIAAKSGESTEVIREKVMNLFAKVLELPVDIKDVDAHVRISQLQEELTALMGGPNGDGWPIDIKGVVDAPGLVQKVREAYKKAKDTINNMAPIAIKMGFSLGQVKVMTEEDIKNAAGGSVFKEMALRAMNEAYKSIAAAEKASNTYGFSLIDPNSGGKVFRDKKNKSEKKGSKEDPEAKAWKERIRLLKDARSWYDKWEKEIGHTAALEKVQGMFKTLVSKKDIESLEAYKKALEEVIRKAEARKAKNGGKDEHADEVIRQGKDAIEDINLMIFKRNSDDIMSSMSKDMDNLTRQWEIFNSVLEATGDRLLALKMAGLSGRSSSERNTADSLRNNIMGMPGGDLINFQKIISMTDKEIEKEVKNILGDSEKYSGHIGAIINGLKEWKKLSQDVMKQDIENFAKLLGSAKDYWSLIMRNNSEYDETMKGLAANYLNGSIDGLGLMKGAAMAAASRDDKNSKISANYLNLMSNATALTRGEVLDAVDNAVMHLDERMKAGLITIEEYVNELKKLDDIKAEWDKGGFFGDHGLAGAALSGGYQGIMNYYGSKYRRYTAEATEARQKYGENSAEYKNTKTSADKYENLYKNMQKLDSKTQNVVKAFTALKEGIDLFQDFLGALLGGGHDDLNAASDVLGGALGGASALSSLGPYGMAAGAAMGALTSIIELGDKEIAQKIEDVKKEIENIERTTSLIRAARERNLGYDSNNLNERLSQVYDNLLPRYISLSNWDEYHLLSGGLNKSGYEQELENLKFEREKLKEQQDLEYSRKESDTGAIDELQDKIRQLDEQIYYYAEDLANELWSIDLKGWADQIGDALMNAFENGTSAAEAFKDATADIMRSVVSEMLKIGFMQPMMEKLRDRLFGENGAFNYADPKSSMGAVLSELGKFFGQGGEGQQMIVASQEFLSGAEELLNKNYGMSLKESSQSTQTKGIQSQATEESIGILSGQMARIAQDVSVKRIFITQIATEQMPKLLESAQMQQTLLENQFQSVRAIEHMMADGDGALYTSIDRMSRKIDRAITPDGRMRVE